MYTVKQASEMTGISTHTLRFYDKEGLFPDLRRDGRNRRLFSEADLRGIGQVQSLRNMGFPIAEIRRYIAKETAATQDRYALIQERRKKVKENLAAVVRQLQLIEREAEYYRSAIEEERARTADQPDRHLQVA